MRRVGRFMGGRIGAVGGVAMGSFSGGGKEKGGRVRLLCMPNEGGLQMSGIGVLGCMGGA